MSEIPTHYANLRVARNAPPEVIRAAYKALMQKHHPDRHPGDAKAERIVRLLNEAYAVLNDPDQRARHDTWIAQQEHKAAPLPFSQAPRPNAAAQAPPARRRGWILVGLLLAFLLGMGLAAQLVASATPQNPVVWQRR
jgi:curved DNA-binding protein CbpA